MHQDKTWGEGIYFLPQGDKAAVIAVHQLPETIETLWLRLLGRGTVQERAFAELYALPKDHPYRELSIRHVAVLQKNLKVRQNLSKDLREVTMALAITYEQIEAELIQQGIEQGAEMTSRAIALEMLRNGMPPELVARLTKLPIDQLPSLRD
jgi:predicted transposase/invertase (TIGR01784 family)